MASEQIRIEQSGRVLTATLVNPPHNFITTQMVRELAALLDRVDADTGIGAVVLTGGVEHAFITHFDVGEIFEGGEKVGKPLSPKAARQVLRLVGALRAVPGLEARIQQSPLGGIVNLMRMHEVFHRIETSPAAFIAAINGRAYGGGFELALACDFRLMARGPGRLALIELLHGLIPGAGGTQRLTHMLGAARARELILDSRALSAEDAHALGLVEAPLSAAELLPQAQTLAERLAQRSRTAVAAAKQAIAATAPEAGYLAERVGFLAAASSPATDTALRSYYEVLQQLAPGSGLEAELERWRAGARVDFEANCRL